MILAEHALLAVAVAALVAAAWRAAGSLTTAPGERALAAAPLGACAAVLAALALGRFGLAGEPLALAGGAVATWLSARLLLPGITSTRAALCGCERGLLLVAAGLLAALVAWLLRNPALGVDGISYHLPEAVGWVQAGDTGSTPVVVEEFQTGSYPLTNEILLAWAMGISRSFAPVALWTGATLSLVILGGWVGLRRLGCAAGLTALALAALLAEPVLVEHLNTPKTDLPALAWLVVCAGLCACAVPGRQALLGPAVAAAGLAVGSKTTTLPLVVIVLAAGLWGCRGSLRTARAALAWGTAAALAVGGVWYVRNLIAHGWFLWPFGSGPFGGDPEPIYLERIHVSFLERPRFTLEGRVGEYVRSLAGGLLLVAGGAAAALVRPRSRLVMGAAAATAVAALAWLAAPFTGRADDPVLDLSLTTTRYLLPVLAAGAAALALAGRTSRPARVVLAVALAWNLARSAQLGFPDVPPAWVLLAGAATGAVIAALGPAVGYRTRLTGGLDSPRVAAVGVAAAFVVLSAAATDGWLERSARATTTDSAPLQAWFASQPGWAERREPVAFVSNVIAPIAGDRLRHPIALIPGNEPCEATLRRVRDGFVVMRDLPEALRRLLAPVRAPECLAGLTPVARPGVWIVYRQTATTSSAASSPSAARRKSPTPMADSRSLARRRRNSVSSRS